MNYSQHAVEYFTNLIDDLLWNFPKFKPAYKKSKKYHGLMEIVKSKECKSYIKKIDILNAKRDLLICKN